MAKSSGQKLKLLYLIKILSENTDEDHAFTLADIITRLEQFGITAERKSLYDDLEELRLFGYDIISRKSRSTEYFLGNRDFELPELKLLVDAVQSAKFISSRKSVELIRKIENLTSVHQSKQLQRQVYVAGRVKTMNESVYYTVDTLHTAIASNRKVSFKYFEYTMSKEKRFRRDGHLYIVSPYALIWDDENYYMIAKYTHEDLTHFRVDKIAEVQILEEEREKYAGQINLAQYVKKTFSMFNGDDQAVTIRFAQDLVGVVIDRFGADVPIEKARDEHFVAHLNVVVSPTFLSWLFQFGPKAIILSPPDVVHRMKEMLNETVNSYH